MTYCTFCTNKSIKELAINIGANVFIVSVCRSCARNPRAAMDRYDREALIWAVKP